MPGPVREFARTLLSLVLTRTRLAATELEEQALRLIEILIWLAAALFFLGIAIVFAAVLVVLVFWDSNRLLAAGLLGLAADGWDLALGYWTPYATAEPTAELLKPLKKVVLK